MVTQRFLELARVQGLSGPRWQPTGRERTLTGESPALIRAGMVASMRMQDEEAAEEHGWVFPHGLSGTIALMPVLLVPAEATPEAPSTARAAV